MSSRVDGRGTRMIELMNANEVVILNDIRGSIGGEYLRWCEESRSG